MHKYREHPHAPHHMVYNEKLNMIVEARNLQNKYLVKGDWQKHIARIEEKDCSVSNKYTSSTFQTASSSIPSSFSSCALFLSSALPWFSSGTSSSSSAPWSRSSPRFPTISIDRRKTRRELHADWLVWSGNSPGTLLLGISCERRLSMNRVTSMADIW